MFLAETEQLIKQARGQKLTATQKLVSLIPERGLVPADMDAHDLVSSVSREPMYLDSEGSVNPLPEHAPFLPIRVREKLGKRAY